MLFQVVYGGGYTYLDRCGQTIVDIERSRPDWSAGDVNPYVGNVTNEPLRMAMSFNVSTFDLNVMRFSDLDVACLEAQALWDVVRENLALTEYVRVASRFHFLLAKTTIEDAEKAMVKAGMQLTLPNAWTEAGFSPTTRMMVAGVKRAGVEYRVGLQTVTRTEGLLPSSLVTTDPRMLPAGRKQARLNALKNRQSYRGCPVPC